MIVDSKTITNSNIFSQFIKSNKIEFFDFGCSNGGSIQYVKKHTKITGLGFDIDYKKIRCASESGCIVTQTDLLDIPGENVIPSVTLFHMLEHVPNIKTAWQYIYQACKLATDHVIIKQPFFDSDCLLLKRGLKTYYSDWTGHPNHMTTAEFTPELLRMRDQKKIRDFKIGYIKPITSSNDPIIIPLCSPIDSFAYDPAIHPPKTHDIKFNFPLFYEIVIAIDINGNGYGRIFDLLSISEVFIDTRLGLSF